MSLECRVNRDHKMVNPLAARIAAHMGMLEVKGQVYGQFSGREFGSKV